MWVITNTGHEPACVFHYADTRSQQVPLNLLSPENNAIMVDGYEARQNQAKPIVEKLKTSAEKSLQTVAPKTKIGEALVYLHKQWERLTCYLEDGNYPIDNNAAERAIRPFTVKTGCLAKARLAPR